MHECNKTIPKLPKIIYSALSYKIMQAAFAIQNKLGNQLQEKYYQRAFEDELAKGGIAFSSQVFVPIQDSSNRYGNYFIDLVIEQKIIVEIKATPMIYQKDIHQVLAYLALINSRLGIIINFRSPRVTYRRIINANICSQ